MATKTKPNSAQATKTNTATASSPATDTIHGKRITGAITRSSSNVRKSPAATVSSVPHYLRPTQSSRTDSPRLGGKKETPATKPNPALTRRQSFDKPPPPAQLQRILFSAGPRSPTMKSPAPSSSRTTSSRPTELSKSLSLSTRSRTANPRPSELVKSNTMPKPGASSRPRSASGSLSRLGSTGKPLQKSPVSGPSSKRHAVNDSNKQHVTDQAEPEAEQPHVIVEEEKATPPPPPPFEDGSVERDVTVFEEVYVEDEHEEEEEVVISPVKEEEHKEVHGEAAIPESSPPDIDTSEESAVEEEDDNHDIEFEEIHGGSIDEGEVHYSDGDQSSKPPQLEDDDTEEVKSDANAEENPDLALQETLLPVEEKVHVIAMEVFESASESQSLPAANPPKVEVTVVPAKLFVRPSLNTQRSTVEKKESPMYNDVIEETASKLLEKRKNKVRALVGAFETVISLQE